MKERCAVVIPIYRPNFQKLEEFGIDYSLARLVGRRMFFAAPATLDLSYYASRYPHIEVIRFSEKYFENTDTYSELLLNFQFYQRFDKFEYTLILQPDALIIRDELDLWMERPYDYIGSPWPTPMTLRINTRPFSDELARTVSTHVANGGLSLRRNDGCIRLLFEYKGAVDLWIRKKMHEDLFFACMGALSKHFVLPSEIVCSMFAIDQSPEYYQAINGGIVPMASHAWWSRSPGFWKEHVRGGEAIFADLKFE